MKKNILILATHWSYYIPFFLRFFLRDEFKKYNNRLIKNYSDFATKYLIEDFDNKIICNYSRALWDPNRDIDAPDLFRVTDFGWLDLWKYKLPKFVKNILIKKYYKYYHNNIKLKIEELEKNNEEIIILDIHDTWNELLWVDYSLDKKRDYYFPEINIWTAGYESCSKNFIDKLSKLFKKEFWFETKIDWPYDWWYVSKKY
jgi:N-formylglutamate amidohydrolase